MKIEYLVDFLPADLRRRSVLRASRRRSGLLIALMTFLVLGVAAHSWNMYRRAEIDRTLSMQVCANSTKVDDVVNKLAADQQNITRFLGVYDQIALPLDTSDLISQVTHLMPEGMSLAMLRMEVQNEKAPAADPRDSKSHANAGKAAPKPAPEAKPAPKTAKATKDGKDAPAARPQRWLNTTIRGYAASNADLYDFERRLSRTTPLEAVTVTENKPVEVPGAQLQEFAITCRIPMDVRYERSAPTATSAPASAPAAAPAPAASAEQARTEGSTK